eukprot:5902892-Pyramimonas_sp.AAC.1
MLFQEADGMRGRGGGGRGKGGEGGSGGHLDCRGARDVEGLAPPKTVDLPLHLLQPSHQTLHRVAGRLNARLAP